MKSILIIVFQLADRTEMILDNLLVRLIIKAKFFNWNGGLFPKALLKEQLLFMKKEKEKLLAIKLKINEKVL